MKIKRNKYIILFFALFFVVSIAEGQSKDYIAKYKPMCDSLSIQFGIPSEVILGIAIEESGYGTSKVCRLLNNHFGIVGKNNLRKTHNIKSRYKYYSSDTASFIHFCKYVSARKYYQKLKGTTNIRKWLIKIGSSGYCRYPKKWTKAIMVLLHRHKLV
jgi:hypothetical protein